MHFKSFEIIQFNPMLFSAVHFSFLHFVLIFIILELNTRKAFIFTKFEQCLCGSQLVPPIAIQQNASEFNTGHQIIKATWYSLYRFYGIIDWLFVTSFCLFLFLQAGFLCVSLAVLKLTMLTGLAWNSKRSACLFLLLAEVKKLCNIF